MGKAADFPCHSILHSPHDIQITLFFNLDKSRQPVLVTEVNSQSWQISLWLSLLPDFYLHKIRTWHHVKKMCRHKIFCRAKRTFSCATLCCIIWKKKQELRAMRKKIFLLCLGVKVAIWLVCLNPYWQWPKMSLTIKTQKCNRRFGEKGTECVPLSSAN